MLVIVLGLFAIIAGCGKPEVKTRYFRAETYTFSRVDRAAIDRISNATAAEV